MEERWRSVVGYEGVYEVSDLGRLRRVRPARGTSAGRLLKPSVSTDVYPRANLWRDGRPRSVLVHRLVAAAFLGEPNVGSQVNHRNGDKTDNRVANLEWTTAAANLTHARSTGLNSSEGEGHGHSKLTAEQVAYARRVYVFRDPTRSMTALAHRFGVDATTMRNAIRGRTWKHVT